MKKMAEEPIRIPETEEEILHEWITPDTRILNKENMMHKPLINPVNRDLTTAFLNPEKAALVQEFMDTWNATKAFSEVNDQDVQYALNFLAIAVGVYNSGSKGYEGGLLKVIKTNWSVHEEKKEEKIDRLEKYAKMDEEKKKKFGFI